jgi:hypothetical protein
VNESDSQEPPGGRGNAEGRSRFGRVVRWGLLTVLTMLLLWVSVTWFVVGTSRPCGVLAARMGSYHARLAYCQEMERRADRLWLAKSGLPSPAPAPTREELLARFHRGIDNLTPPQCLWHVVTWRIGTREEAQLAEAERRMNFALERVGAWASQPRPR